MAEFYPYEIEHLQFTQLEDFIPLKQNYYIVLWWKKVPLGHIYYEYQKHNKTDLNSLALKAVSKAIQFYISQNSSSVNYSDFEQAFEEADKASLGNLLNSIIRVPLENFTQSISVVICTRNRPQAIEACIKSLMASSDRDFELIIVDNAPDNDLTEQAVKKFHGVKYVREARKGLDIARNTGAKNASHAIVAYTDDDVVVDADWVKNIKSCFNHPLTMAVTGLVIPLSLQTKAQYIFEKDWGFNKGYLPLVFDSEYFNVHKPYGVPVWDIGAGANMAFRKEAFEIAGFFDERLDVGASGCSGDSEMWYRILAEGWNCNYYPHLFVYHQHRETQEELTNQLFHYMRGNVSSLLVQYEKYKHKGNLRRLYRSLPQYYFQRIYRSLIKLQSHNLSTILTEMRGCISGWKFYRAHKNTDRYQRKYRGLTEDADIKPDTRVSIIIPCYNHAHYLPAAIESVLAQTYKHVEVIVVDDGSDDHTAEVCRRYPNVKYKREERVGLSAARNSGVKIATGRFLVFLDADDMLLENAIETNLFYFSYFKNIVYVSGAHDKIDDDGNPLPSPQALQKMDDCYEALLQGNYIGMEATVMYRRELFFAFSFDPEFKACEDYDLNLRIARYFPVYSHTKKIAIYRIHTQNMSRDSRLMLGYALKALSVQASLLKTETEKEAFSLGTNNWTSYYKV